MEVSPFALVVTPLPLLALIAAIEGWLLRRAGRDHDWKAYWASLGDAAGRIAVNLMLKSGVVGVVLYAVWEWRVATFTMDRWWHWALLFLGQEFCYYWMHRADHRVRWLWLNHSVHHSSNQYTLSAAYRLGWTGKITGAAVIFAPLVWIGFPVPLVVAAVAGNLLYQFWLHTELIGRLPRPIEYIFNTPSHHRVHHASNPGYIDCNYGGILIVFDRLFGSFRREREEEPPRYGLTSPLHSYNPVRIAFHAWTTMFRDMRQARGWSQRVKVLFGPPEYKPFQSTPPAAPTGTDAH